MIFSHPAFLWGLLSVAIPILIHLLQFRRYRKVYFSNVDNLDPIVSEQRRNQNIRQWLILAARVLAIVFLVLAFARPIIPQHKANTRVGTTAVSVYIDNSFSMEQASSEGSLIDQAMRKAREIAAAYDASDLFQLVTNDMSGTQMHLLNRDDFLATLDQVQASAATPMMSTVAERQRTFLDQSHTRHHHCYIISDFQRSTADIEAIPQDSSRLITLVPLKATDCDNLYIDTATLDAPAYFVGGTVLVEATVRNSSPRDAEGIPLKLYIDGRERAVATVDIAAGSATRCSLRFPLDHAGTLAGTLTIDDYPITFDDHYHFALRVGDPIQTIEVDGNAPNRALHHLLQGDSIIPFTATSHLPADLASTNFIILNEPLPMSSGEVLQLSEWVKAGGSLLVIPSEATEALPTLNSLLSSLEAPQLDHIVRGQLRAATINTEAPLYRGVFCAVDDEMEMPVVQWHYATLRSPHTAINLISFADGSPLLAATPAGQGMLYLLTTPLHPDCNSLSTQALFVPTLYNMALYSHPLPPASYTLGSSIAIELHNNYDLRHNPPQMSNREGLTFIPNIHPQGSKQLLMIPTTLTTDGIYTLGNESFAFNYPRRESELTYLSASDIKDAIHSRSDLTLTTNTSASITHQLRQRDSGHPLWRLMLILSLLMLAVETALIKFNR